MFWSKNASYSEPPYTLKCVCLVLPSFDNLDIKKYFTVIVDLFIIPLLNLSPPRAIRVAYIGSLVKIFRVTVLGKA